MVPEYAYTGDVFQNTRHGHGEVRFRAGPKVGDKCTGTFEHDELIGIGIYTYANGDVYDGMFCREIREGEGCMTYATGDVYSGGWRSGVYHGRGCKTWVHGRMRSYDGDWWVAAAARVRASAARLSAQGGRQGDGPL